MNATIQRTPMGTAVGGIFIWISKREAVAFAKSHGWMVKDVQPAYHKHFGWKGYIIGQAVSTDTFRAFASEKGDFVEADIMPTKYEGR